MREFISLSRPNLAGNEIKYVTDALKSQWVSTGGEMIPRFEKCIAEYVQAPGAVACQSGTAGLHLVLHAMGIGPDDEVIVPTLTFIAAVNPVSYVGAHPVFMDCGDDLCMDAGKLEQFCKEECSFINGVLTNKTTGRLIAAILVVHVFGNMADMPAILRTAQTYNLKLIEDATEALGTHYPDGAFAGTMGDAGVFSFNGNKIITTGGGGMIVSHNVELLSRLKYLSTQAKNNEVYFIHDEIGFNYRMTNLQAAMGVAQMEQLEGFIKTKQRNLNLYKEALCGKRGLDILPFRTEIRPNYWFYSLYLKES
ncbi:MAG: aminotransferase class I/II-fold pyridoxal phosphate-dependent enzyme, partial [Eubacteriales bacterium]